MTAQGSALTRYRRSLERRHVFGVEVAAREMAFVSLRDALGLLSLYAVEDSQKTAKRRRLDATGNLKATQKLLGHASIQTTGDVYADWDIDQLADTMRLVVEVE